MIKNQELMYHAGLAKGLLDEALRTLTMGILPSPSTPQVIANTHSAVEKCTDEWKKAN